MSNKRKKIWIRSTLFIGLLILLFLRIPVISVNGDNHTFFIKENSFILGWIHSIEKEEWFESYQIDNGEIALTETHFKTFGAGTPYQVEGTKTENGFITMELDLTYEEFYLTISEEVETTLFIDDRKVPLYNYFDPFETVLIKVENVSIWDYLRGDYL